MVLRFDQHLEHGVQNLGELLLEDMMQGEVASNNTNTRGPSEIKLTNMENKSFDRNEHFLFPYFYKSGSLLCKGPGFGSVRVVIREINANCLRKCNSMSGEFLSKFQYNQP